MNKLVNGKDDNKVLREYIKQQDEKIHNKMGEHTFQDCYHDRVHQMWGLDSNEVKYVFEFVDLGLSSGTLWATCNLGASKPEDKGLYYAWAETEGYKDSSSKDFYWDDYKWGTRNNFTKYTIASSTMQLTDDAAYNINDEAKIPTPTQVEELLSLTKVVESNGVRFIGNNGNEIFIPFSGNYYSGSLRETGTAFFWTNKLDSSFVNMGRALKADENYGLVTSDPGRCYGLPIRPVKK